MSYTPSALEVSLRSWIVGLLPGELAQLVIFEGQDGLRPAPPFVSLLLIGTVPIGTAGNALESDGSGGFIEVSEQDRQATLRITCYGAQAGAGLSAQQLGDLITQRYELMGELARAGALGLAPQRMGATRRLSTAFSQATEDRVVIEAILQYNTRQTRAELRAEQATFAVTIGAAE